MLLDLISGLWISSCPARMMGERWGDSFKDDAQNFLNPSSSTKNGWFEGDTDVDH
jgi:hypothetical protein